MNFFKWLLSLQSGKNKGSGMIIGTLVACAIVGIIALKSSNMGQLTYNSFVSAAYTTTGQQYALNKIEELRNVKYSAIQSKALAAVAGSNGFYEEVIVRDSVRPVTSRSGNSDVHGKDIEVRVYKGSGADQFLCSSLKLNRVDPAEFDSGFNMVINDSSSDSEYKAMSADAFKDLVDSKVINSSNYDDDEAALSAKAVKTYLAEKLLPYALKGSSAWYDGKGTSLGSKVRGIYLNVDGKAMLTDIEFRGKRTNAANALVLVPLAKAGGGWYYDWINRNDLHKKYLDQLYFTFTIVQSPHQTITVTTADGVEHTETFSIKYGTSWTASLKADAGYIAGTLSATSGIAYGATTVSATSAHMSLYGFEICNADGTNRFFDAPSRGNNYYIHTHTEARLESEYRYNLTPPAYTNIVNGVPTTLDFTAPSFCRMLVIQYNSWNGSDENPYAFTVTGNGKVWYARGLLTQNTAGPVARFNNRYLTSFVKLTPGKTYHIVFAGFHGRKSRTYGCRFFFGDVVNPDNYTPTVDADT